ncbi:hypothetical protein V3C99_009050, partial [Haemonchus contortus]
DLCDMVGTRSGKRTSKGTGAMDNGRSCASPEDCSSANNTVYDLPLDSSDDSNCRDSTELRRTEQHIREDRDLQQSSSSPLNVQRLRRKTQSFTFSTACSSKSSKTSDRRRSKRFRTESDGALNLREALRLPIATASNVANQEMADAPSENLIASQDRLQPSHSRGVNMSPTHVDSLNDVLLSSAPAKTTEVVSPSNRPTYEGRKRRKSSVWRSRITKRLGEEDAGSSLALECSARGSSPQVPKTDSTNSQRTSSKTSRDLASDGAAAPDDPPASPKKSPQSISFNAANGNNSTPTRINSALRPSSARATHSARSVRFGSESLNAVHIIPSVATTLPFAEQMAKEREAEALEVSLHQPPNESELNCEYPENEVPKCSKVIIGQRYIAIDRFVRKDECKYHFLTHAHTDHFVNLNKSWKTPIYCSEVTAKLLPVMMGARAIPPRLLRPLKVGETHVIEPNLHVTVLDANHCVGSAMFLFEGASVPGGAVLCTGDFRADHRLLSRFNNDPSFIKLADTYISKIYFDNTHLDRSEGFPDRAEAEKMVMNELEKLRDCSILIPVFKLGREEILERISQSFSEVISTSSVRINVRKVCDMKNGEFSDTNDSSARICTSQRHPRQVLDALKRMPDPKVVLDLSVRGEYKGLVKEKLISIPYSDHSSRSEIIAFLSRLRFGELIPISAPMDSSTTLELMKLSREARIRTIDEVNWAKRKYSLRLLQD